MNLRLMLFLPLMLALQVSAQTAPDISGTWQATDAPGTTWVFELKVDGNKVTGTVSQTGAKTESAPIYFGSIEGNTLTFKANSSDGDRIITFIGKITSANIGLQKLVEVRPG